ncbi:hypothetical protein [Telmatospirillum sp. J64-1]|uniref:hypothetical protein n=1 Tax=Telmatospirillum sp. J64-1 TaxID=2502183 RepID=UPI00115D76C9|nr:hypothetical protein [Telmatospirillum sp. J64-1]
MKRFLIISGMVLTLGGCATSAPLDLTPTSAASASDPEWIREYDAKMISEQAAIQEASGRRMSRNGQILMWQNLDCMRRVDVSQLRAAKILMQTRGLSRAQAIAETQADPGWEIARQGCDR